MTAAVRPGRFVVTEVYARRAAAGTLACVDILLGREDLLTPEEARTIWAARDVMSRYADGEYPLGRQIMNLRATLWSLDNGWGSETAVIAAARAIGEPAEHAARQAMNDDAIATAERLMEAESLAHEIRDETGDDMTLIPALLDLLTDAGYDPDRDPL